MPDEDSFGLPVEAEEPPISVWAVIEASRPNHTVRVYRLGTSEVLPVAAGNLIRLREGRQRVRDTHLARFVALQAHLFENLASA